MENKILLRELENKNQVHEIFQHQTSKDLKDIIEIIKRDYPNDILIDFDKEEYWQQIESIVLNQTEEYRTSYHINYDVILQTEIKVIDQYIAQKILENLSEKNTPLKMFFNKEELSIFKTGDKEKYKAKSDSLPTSDDIKEILTLDEQAPTRIHFIVNGIKSNRLCDALSTYLDNATTFSTRIYLSPSGFYTATVNKNGKKEMLWSIYDYISFDENREGYQPMPYNPRIKKVGQKKNRKI